MAGGKFSNNGVVGSMGSVAAARLGQRTLRIRRSVCLAVPGVLLALGGAAAAQANLTINATFDSTFVTAAGTHVSEYEAQVNDAIATVESYIANPVTVNITFDGMSSGLGQSLTYLSTTSYSSYLNSLRTQQTLSSYDNTALASLPNSDPVPGNTSNTVETTLPVFRALGYSENPPPGQPDSTISLNLSITSWNSSPSPSQYSTQSVAAHEIDEVLGIGGTGSQLASGNLTTGAVGPLDLFRYTAAGARSYATGTGIAPYFSIDGGNTDLVHFNQYAVADYSDWGNGVTPAQQQGNNPPQVQDAFGTPGVNTVLGRSELIGLDVVGWNLTPAGAAVETPEASTLALLGGAMGLILLPRKRRP